MDFLGFWHEKSTTYIFCTFKHVFIHNIRPDGAGTINGYYICPNVELSVANLSGSKLYYIYSMKCNIAPANLRGANLVIAIFSNSGFLFVSLQNARLNGTQGWIICGVVRHRGPCSNLGCI